jgi:perosamine synthetase
MSITTSLSPNTEKDDVLLALKLLFQPWKWTKGQTAQTLESDFKQYFKTKYAISFESGRTCLYSILSSLNLKPEDEVLIQSYTCVAVPEPILWVNAKPIYVDINPQTLNTSAEDLEKKITKNSKVIIIQHTFGNPAGLKQIIEIAKRHNLFIIEDCCHALGAEYHDKKVGTFGDVSFFSFGRDKVISSVFGGILVANNEEIGAEIEDFKEKKCRLPSKGWVLQQILHPIIFATVKPLYTFLNLGKIILEVSKRLRITSKAVYAEEKQGKRPNFILKKLPNAMAMMALHQFKKLNKLNDHRRDLANFYTKELENEKIQTIKEESNTKNIYLRYTVLTKNPAEIHKEMRKHNIYLGDWYDRAVAPKGVNYQKIHYNPQACPNAEKAAEMTINLPTHIGISKNDAQQIIKHLKKCLSKSEK